jgi:hypothetical protein
MLLLLQLRIIHHQRFLLSKISLRIKRKLNFFLNLSLINRDYQTTNIAAGQTIMLTNSPNSIVLTGQQQAQPIPRHVVKQEPTF